MNELTYSFIGSLRAWLYENVAPFEDCGVTASMPAYVFHYGTRAQFASEHFEAGFYVWEKRHWHKAMSDIEFVDWRIADLDPEYQVEVVHYEYSTICEMLDTLDVLKQRLLSVQRDNG